MMDSDLLNRAFEVSESPGLDTFDDRLGDITTLAQDGKFEEAAPLIASVFEEQIYDIRIIGYYAYAVFVENGVAGLGNVFGGLAEALTSNWAAVGPLGNRPKITQNSLGWLFRMLLKKLQWEEGQNGREWARWTEVSSEQVEESLEAGDRLRRAILSALEDDAGPVMDHYLKALDWLRAFQRVVYREPEPESEPEPEPEPESEEGERQTRPAAGRGGVTVEASPHFALLLRKLQAFEQLIAEERFSQAALVADDLSAIMSSFDPVLYLPSVFSSFARLLALHSKDLAEFEDAKESREWNALRAYYLMDLDGFLKL